MTARPPLCKSRLWSPAPAPTPSHIMPVRAEVVTSRPWTQQQRPLLPGGGSPPVPGPQAGTGGLYQQCHPRLNIAIKALVRPGGTVVISGYEHNAVTRPLHAIPDVTVRVAAGQLFRPEETVEAFRKALTPEVTAAVFTHVSNVFGMILPSRSWPGFAGNGGSPSSWTRPSQRAASRSIWRNWGQPSSPCRATRGCTAPRGPVFCSADRPRHLCWRGAREVNPSGRRCRTSCPTVWRRGPQHRRDRRAAGGTALRGKAGGTVHRQP